MIPSEYRLEKVAARLVERLESTRRTYAGDPDGAAAAFARIADEVVTYVIAEYQADGFVDAPKRHARFLRQEIRETFLPRYTRAAVAMTAREEGGYGLGPLYGVAGRVVVVLGVLLITALLLRMPGPLAARFGLMLPLVFGVFVPDVVAWLARRRHRSGLVDMLQDLKRIQDHERDYLASVSDRLEEGASNAEPRVSGAEAGSEAAIAERQARAQAVRDPQKPS